MKRLLFYFFLLALFITIPMAVSANDIIIELDSLNDEATIANYQKSINICEKALKTDPDAFELNWRCARAYRWYGELAKRAGMKDWEDICAKYGKMGMDYAQKASELEPSLPHGYYWYGVNVGIYSDGVSIVRAISEGLKGKTQKNFEKVYEADKNFENAGAILSLGRFWAVLPWPLNDKKLSLKYYREYQKTEHFGIAVVEGPIFLSELLIDMGSAANKTEAKQLLGNVKTDNKYFKDRIQKLLAKLDKQADEPTSR